MAERISDNRPWGLRGKRGTPVSWGGRNSSWDPGASRGGGEKRSQRIQEVSWRPCVQEEESFAERIGN